MKNINDFKTFRELKTGSSILNEDVIQFGDSFRVRGFDVPVSLINAFKKKAKDSGNDIAGKFSDTELAEYITRYVQTNFLIIDNLPMAVLGNEYDKVNVQPVAQAPVVQEPATQIDGQTQNAQAQTTAQEIPATEGGQTQTPIQPQGQNSQEI